MKILTYSDVLEIFTELVEGPNRMHKCLLFTSKSGPQNV